MKLMPFTKQVFRNLVSKGFHFSLKNTISAQGMEYPTKDIRVYRAEKTDEPGAVCVPTDLDQLEQSIERGNEDYFVIIPDHVISETDNIFYKYS